MQVSRAKEITKQIRNLFQLSQFQFFSFHNFCFPLLPFIWHWISFKTVGDDVRSLKNHGRMSLVTSAATKYENFLCFLNFNIPAFQDFSVSAFPLSAFQISAFYFGFPLFVCPSSGFHPKKTAPAPAAS